MAPKKDKDIVAPFIQGPSMDWTMDDGLYSHFQTWKISCNLILDSELCELSEVRRVNTLLRWSGDFGIKKLKSWQKEPSQLMLNFIWGEYESYCKPQSNELHARYDVLKKLTQGSLPADDWMTNSNHSSTFAITNQRRRRCYSGTYSCLAYRMSHLCQK